MFEIKGRSEFKNKNKSKEMSQNLQDQVEHIDFTDYYSDIKSGAAQQSSEKDSERLDTNESENPQPHNQYSSYSKSGKKRCAECEKCDLDPECCNHEENFHQ